MLQLADEPRRGADALRVLRHEDAGVGSRRGRAGAADGMAADVGDNGADHQPHPPIPHWGGGRAELREVGVGWAAQAGARRGKAPPCSGWPTVRRHSCTNDFHRRWYASLGEGKQEGGGLRR